MSRTDARTELPTISELDEVVRSLKRSLTFALMALPALGFLMGALAIYLFGGAS
jgi:hypothetical protein